MDEQIKRLLREGLYWEALELPPGSPYPDIAIRIATMKHDCRGDQEAMILLAEAQQDFINGGYLPAREFCDELFAKIGDFSRRPIFGQDIITRESMWRQDFRPNLSSIQTIRSQCAKTLRKGAIQLFNDSAEDHVEFNQAVLAQDKGIHCLETALIYTDDRRDIEAQLRTAKELKARFICNHGVNQINKAQEKLKSKIEREMAKVSPSLNVIQNTFGIAIEKAQKGIAHIEVARRLDEQSTFIQEQLNTGENILAEIRKQREQAGELVNKNSAMSLCNRGIERINKAQEDLQAKMQVVQSESSSGYFYRSQQTFLLSCLEDAIIEVKAGISDIEEAKRLAPSNQHINRQLETAREILKNMGGQTKEPSSKPKTAHTTQDRVHVSQKQQHGTAKQENVLGRAVNWIGRFVRAFFE